MTELTSVTLRVLERLGADPRPVDRDPTHPFAVGGAYANCPRCEQFAAITVERDLVHWRGLCACWNPRERHDEIDLLLLAKAA